MPIKDVEFSVNTIGDVTGERWSGTFRASKFLSHRQQLARDQKRRELLGPQAADADVRARNQAEIFSQLFVRLVDAPAWWKDAGYGMDLVDDNVAVDVYTAALKVETDAVEEVKKRAEADRDVLKKLSSEEGK